MDTVNFEDDVTCQTADSRRKELPKKSDACTCLIDVASTWNLAFTLFRKNKTLPRIRPIHVGRPAIVVAMARIARHVERALGAPPIVGLPP